MTEGPFGGSSCQRRPNSSLFVVFLNIVHIIELGGWATLRCFVAVVPTIDQALLFTEAVYKCV
jgi:hypothetical protein